MWADRRAVSQPNPSVCLCANAVLKWAHYHQREHKHSSRKQDSLCQEREPLPQAYCRPNEITRLKIRQGSYYDCRHAPQAVPLSTAEEDNPHSCSNIPFHLFFFSDCSLCFSPVALSVCCKLQEVQGVLLSELKHKFHHFSYRLPSRFQWQISWCYWALREKIIMPLQKSLIFRYRKC